MCDVTQPGWYRPWVKLHKHRKATVRDWDASRASGYKDAQYNPHRFHTDAEILAIEESCIADEANLQRDTGDQRQYVMRIGGTVGVCRGTPTAYLYVEWTLGKGFHGRPMCPAAIRDLFGINVPP
jgi:hypothetical protein